MSKPVKKRQGIDNITRLKICEFVASQQIPPSTKVLREWAETTFNRKFPQSTLSTLLRSNGLQIKQAGGRGRRCRADRNKAAASSPDKLVRSERTNVLVSHLKLLADGRCRGRSSDHPHIELCVLEEVYLLLRHGGESARRIGASWFQSLTRRLFAQHNEPLPKNISQFLNQIYDKYFLINMVYKHMFEGLAYDDMREKLAVVFPDLQVDEPPAPSSSASLPAQQWQPPPAPVQVTLYDPQTPPPEDDNKLLSATMAQFPPSHLSGSLFSTPPSPFPNTPMTDHDYTPRCNPTFTPCTSTNIPLSDYSDLYQFLPVQIAEPEHWDPLEILQHRMNHDSCHPSPCSASSLTAPCALPSTPSQSLFLQEQVEIPDPAAADPTDNCVLIPAAAKMPSFSIYASFSDYQTELDLGYNEMLDQVFDS